MGDTISNVATSFGVRKSLPLVVSLISRIPLRSSPINVPQRG